MPWKAKAIGLGAAAAVAALLAGVGTAAPASSHDGHAGGAAAPQAQHQGHAGTAAAPAEATGDHGYGGHGVWPKPETLGGNFSLTDHTGRRVTLEDFKGKALAVYFGYTNCDDICPLIGTKLGRALDLMGDKGDQVNIAVISVDDRRDGPAEMAAFVSKIHPRLIGLSGTRREIYEVAARFRVRRDHVPTNQVAKPGEEPAAEAGHGGHGSGHGGDAPATAAAAPAAVPVAATPASDTGTGRRVRIRSASDAATRLHNMALAHSTHIYLVDRTGQVRNYIYPGMSPEQMATRLTGLADGG